MKIYDWYLNNKRLALKLMGGNFLVMALVLLFWSAPQESASENERAAANVARMEARMQGKGTAPKDNRVNLLGKHMEKQQQQLRVLLILMVIAGAGFLAYGFLKKDDN